MAIQADRPVVRRRSQAAGTGLGDISVVIPARNAEASIGRTLRSLIPDHELLREILLIDDDSGDATARIARSTAARWRLPLTVHRTRAGSPGAARNAGIELASGTFLFFLDADDELIAGGLGLLHRQMQHSTAIGVAIGASLRRTEGRPDKLKQPAGYGDDRLGNAHRYLTNRMWPIAMGSALVRASAVSGVRFSTAAALDEDTCYWAEVLTRTDAATVPEPVLVYWHDELRMSERFTRTPRKTLLAISRELNRLRRLGVDRRILQWRKAWIALRIARQLIMRQRFVDARRLLRTTWSHPEFRWTWKSIQYSLRIRIGGFRQKLRPHRARIRVGRPTSRPPRTLVLTADPAVPPVSGAELRNWQTASAAATAGPVAIVSVRPLRESPGDLANDLCVAALTESDTPRGRSLARRRTSIDIRIPRSAAGRLVELAKQFQPDTVILGGLPLFPLLKYVKPHCRSLILDMQNVESHLSSQLESSATLADVANIRRGDSRRLRRLERKAVKLVDRVWVCSHRDEDRLRRHHRVGIPVDVVPNGIPRFTAPAELPTALAVDRRTPTIAFVGHLGYAPNVDAVERLATSILPHVRAHFPGATLVVAGRNPAPSVQALASLPGVRIEPNPPDAIAVLRRAHITAIPLRFGGGTRLKILEAMAWGVPVVSSALAADGLSLADGDDVVMAETDDEFARQIVSLLDDPVQMESLRRAAHAKVAGQYGRQTIERAVRSGLGVDPRRSDENPPSDEQGYSAFSF